MANSYTTNYNLTKPEVGGDRDQWGAHYNANFDTLDGALKAVSTTATAAKSVTSIMTGIILPFAGDTAAPAGTLLCNGQLVSRATYPELFAVLGTRYGAGDGTTFGVPDLRGRSIFGLDPDATGRLSLIDPTTLGYVGGSQYLHTHSHGVNDNGHAHGVYDPSHVHYAARAGLNCGYGSGQAYVGDGNPGYAYNVTGAYTGISIYGATTGITIQNAGSGGAQNLPPLFIATWVIVTGKAPA